MDDRFILKPDDITILQTGERGEFLKTDFNIGDIVELHTNNKIVEITQIDFTINDMCFDFLVKSIDNDEQLLINVHRIKRKIEQKQNNEIIQK